MDHDSALSDPAFSGGDPVKLIVALDDVEALTATHRGEVESCLDTLLHCFSQLRENRALFCIVVGRPTAVHELVKPQARYPDRTAVLHAPFTEIVFDKHPSFPLNPAQVLKSSSHLDLMVKFGRSG